MIVTERAYRVTPCQLDLFNEAPHGWKFGDMVESILMSIQRQLEYGNTEFFSVYDEVNRWFTIRGRRKEDECLQC